MEFPSDVVSSKLLLPACWDRKEESPGLLLSSGGSSCLSEGTILPVSSFLFLFFSVLFFSLLLFFSFFPLFHIFLSISLFFFSLFFSDSLMHFNLSTSGGGNRKVASLGHCQDRF